MTCPQGYNYVSEPHARPLDGIHINSLLHAISSCESNLDPLAINPRSGARGLYQFREATWHSFGSHDFLDAHKPGIARTAALRYLAFLARLLLDHGHPVTVLNLATLWTHGTLTRGIPEYSHRVLNLYTDSVSRLPPTVLPPPSLPSSDPR